MGSGNDHIRDCVHLIRMGSGNDKDNVVVDVGKARDNNPGFKGE